jgi:UDP-N-acetylmuramate dehydrogenase
MLDVSQNFSLKNYNSFGIDIQTKYFFEFDNLQDLKEILKQFERQNKLFLGEGSNILFTKNFDGIVLKNKIKGIEITEENQQMTCLKVGAGENWANFVRFCVEKGYKGIENLALIPGSVGASPIQNIGAYGVEVKDLIKKVYTYHIQDQKEYEFENQNCKFGYRDSIFKQEKTKQNIILYVEFCFFKNAPIKIEYGDIRKTLQGMNITHPPTPLEIYEAICKIRTYKLPNPLEIGNAGSFFKNPEILKTHFQKLQEKFPEIPFYPIANTEKVKVPAGWLIEKAGWKGKKIENIGVHPRQALVLVNYGGGKGNEILALAQSIQANIKEIFEIDLEAEVNII